MGVLPTPWANLDFRECPSSLTSAASGVLPCRVWPVFGLDRRSGLTSPVPDRPWPRPTVSSTDCVDASHRHQGTPRRLALLPDVPGSEGLRSSVLLFLWTVPRSISLSASYIPGPEIFMVDALSRNGSFPSSTLTWSLRTEVFSGPWFTTSVSLQTDLLASALNHQLPLFASLDGMGPLQDALALDRTEWDFHLPPPSTQGAPVDPPPTSVLQREGPAACPDVSCPSLVSSTSVVVPDPDAASRGPALPRAERVPLGITGSSRMGFSDPRAQDLRRLPTCCRGDR